MRLLASAHTTILCFLEGLSHMHIPSSGISLVLSILCGLCGETPRPSISGQRTYEEHSLPAKGSLPGTPRSEKP
jgi:hypothetical protein